MVKIITEIWKDIKDYEGLYQISNLGNIKSITRTVKQGKYGNTRIIPEKILKPTNNGNGYLIIGLRKNNSRKNCYVHRLVAQHFIPNKENFGYVNHKDYNTYNNCVDNLEWCTQQHNVLYSSGRMKKPHKSWKPSATNEKHIYLKNNKYRLCIKNIIDKNFNTLSEAIQAREVVLNGGR